ncbi:hypothetical protein [Hydrogenophaga sp.]|uniref:hypothetical protein n=1 Tax=Hydrogenophaga sp. TaxID=1904254 RepID=UPI0035B422FD
MAGDWIKMRSDLFTHPKVVRISSALKADTLRTVGGLMSVWCLFDAHSTDGHLDGYTPDVLDDHLRWPGFSRAMVQVGWLETDGDDALVLPRFDTHNGQSAKRRAQDADRKREVRKTSASDADKKRTREEKRREEINTSPNGDGDKSEAEASGAVAPAKPADVMTKDELWSAGKSLLAQAGIPKAQCGSLIGKLVKDYGDVVVIEAVRAAVVTRPADPVAYIKAACMHSAGQRANAAPKSFAEQDREAGMRRWEEMTGRVHPDRQQGGAVFAVTNQTLDVVEVLR